MRDSGEHAVCGSGSRVGGQVTTTQGEKLGTGLGTAGGRERDWRQRELEGRGRGRGRGAVRERGRARTRRGQHGNSDNTQNWAAGGPAAEEGGLQLGARNTAAEGERQWEGCGWVAVSACECLRALAGQAG